MWRAGQDNDDTIIVRRPPPKKPKKSSKRFLLIFGILAISCAGGGFAWRFLGPAPLISIDTETEAQIDAAQPCKTVVSYFALDRSIVVVDFPNLKVQGLMLDRVAALIEKAKLPRNNVLDDVALRAAIYNNGETIEDYYYGHDYKAADLAKFFRLADAEHIQLNAQEEWLRRLITQLGWLAPAVTGALITLPAATPPITEEMRAVILHHELSHGAFYTIPKYADYVAAFWNSLTEQDRTAFTDFLGKQGYDTSNTKLMYNETQAYLVFTTNPAFFNASAVGMSKTQVEGLRSGYIDGLPEFWLKDMANETLPVASAAQSCPREKG